MIRRVRRIFASMYRQLCEYSVTELEPDETLMGEDACGVIHALTWRFNVSENLITGRCGARITTRFQGTIDCMTCLVKDMR